MTKENFEKLVKEVYGNACNKGFHDKERDFISAMQLVSDEVSELHDAYRHGKLFKQCDKPITNFTCFEEETADIVIRLMDNIGEYQVDIDDVMLYWNEKSEYVHKSLEISLFCFEINSYLFGEDDDLGFIAGCILAIVEQVSIQNGYSIWDSIESKMAYNATRERLHGKKF